MRTAIFVGTFNPFTIGHADIVERALNLFDKVIIGIGYNPDKTEHSSVESNVIHLREIYKNDKRVEVEAYSDLTIDFAARHEAVAIVKGVRSVKDYEYEREQGEMNKLLSGGELETVLLLSKPELSAISSSMVRTLQHFGKNVDEFVVQQKA